MLTHLVTRRIDLAHEPGQWIEARMPSLAILDRAREAGMRLALERVAGIDLAQFKDIAAKPDTDARSQLDAMTMIAACVTGWSYPEPVTPENVAELDEATVDAVMAVLVPTETEGEQKNASGGSTTTSTATGKRRTNG